MATSQQISLFGIKIHPVTFDSAVSHVLQWVHTPHRDRAGTKMVVTPNLNHLRKLETDQRFRAAYEAADLVTADGKPLVWASRLLGPPLPERVAGSDLTVALLQAAESLLQPLRVFIMGGAPDVAKKAAWRMERHWRNVEVVGHYSPPRGFLGDRAESRKMVRQVNDAEPQLLLVCLGAPQQEVWLNENRHALKARVGLCVGATVDFLAGSKARAPLWMQRSGLEWAHRVLSEPTRLGPRYWRDMRIAPSLLWREWRKRSAANTRADREAS